MPVDVRCVAGAILAGRALELIRRPPIRRVVRPLREGTERGLLKVVDRSILKDRTRRLRLPAQAHRLRLPEPRGRQADGNGGCRNSAGRARTQRHALRAYSALQSRPRDLSRDSGPVPVGAGVPTVPASIASAAASVPSSYPRRVSRKPGAVHPVAISSMVDGSGTVVAFGCCREQRLVLQRC